METKRMRRITALGVACLFVLGGVALAEEARGTIQTVDPTSGRIVLENGSTLAVHQDTQIRVEGKQGKLEDLQPGEEIKAGYQDEGGENTATTIVVSRGISGTSQGTLSQAK